MFIEPNIRGLHILDFNIIWIDKVVGDPLIQFVISANNVAGIIQAGLIDFVIVRIGARQRNDHCCQDQDRISFNAYIHFHVRSISD